MYTNMALTKQPAMLSVALVVLLSFSFTPKAARSQEGGETQMMESAIRLRRETANSCACLDEFDGDGGAASNVSH